MSKAENVTKKALATDIPRNSASIQGLNQKTVELETLNPQLRMLSPKIQNLNPEPQTLKPTPLVNLVPEGNLFLLLWLCIGVPPPSCLQMETFATGGYSCRGYVGLCGDYAGTLVGLKLLRL